MTLISFATYGDHAEFTTDSTSYTGHVEELGRCTKAIPLPHLDAAVLAQGDSVFGNLAKGGALQVSGQVATFDQLVDTAPEWIMQAWEHHKATTTRKRLVAADSVVFLLGWSDRDGEFVAYAFPGERDFQPMQIKRTWIMPTPWDYRPSGRELRSMKVSEAGHPDVDKAAEIWALKPVTPQPQSLEDWRSLAIKARDQRSLDGTFARVIVAGEVFHTHLGRGEIHTRRIHQFNDEGEEFLSMIAWTCHPQAQAMECHCGSGERYVDCHLAEYLDSDCGCGSGTAFRECCMVGVARAREAS